MSMKGEAIGEAMPLLEVCGISKSFPGVRALSEIEFRLLSGTVHVLCGENGAGKSTFVKILDGVCQPDSGEIWVCGKRVRIDDPITARRLGIGMIFQELDYVPDATVEQSLFLGSEPRNRIGGIDWRKIRRRTIELLNTEELPYLPTTKLKDLTVSDIQILEILKAVSSEKKILLMDEPTSAITDREIERLFEKIAQLSTKGVGIIYISHKMDEIFKIADEITVFRDGETVGHEPAATLDKENVISMMVGRRIETAYPLKDICVTENVALQITSLTRKPFFNDISFFVRSGEVVGIAGLVGAGRTEIARAIFGLDPFDSGQIKVNGQPVRIDSVSDAINAGIGMLSEDRKRYGLILCRNVKENASLLVLESYFRYGRNAKRAEQRDVSTMFEQMNVKTPSLAATARTLSGGNQQKIVLTKWLLKNQEVVILDEPTRGIDVGAKFEIYKIILDLARNGKAILLISSELPELIGLSDRMYVMAKGKITAELSRDQFDQKTVMNFATQGR